MIHVQVEPIGRYWKPERSRFESCAHGSLLILAPWPEDMPTFASDYALDFTDTGIEAYIAKADGTTGVTFTPVNKIPIGTGVLLHKEGGATVDDSGMPGIRSSIIDL